MALNVWESFDKLVYYNVRILLIGTQAHPGFFSRDGKIKGIETKVPQCGPGSEPQWRSGDKAPGSR